MESGIYKIELNNGYYYFGQAQCLKKRKSIHFARLKQGKHENHKLQNVFNKYGGNTFIVIEYCGLDIISEREQFYIDAHFTDPKCCNLSPSSDTIRGFKRSEESNNKSRIARLGFVFSTEHRNNISKGLLNAYATTRSKPDLNGKNNPFFNKKHSEKTRIQMSEKRKGKVSGGNNYNAKLIINLQTGIFYPSCVEASEAHNINQKKLRRMLNGGRPNKTSFIKA